VTLTRNHWLALAGGASFLGFLLVFLPASLALRWAGGTTLQASDVSGTLWEGEAGQLQVRGMTLTGLRWKLSTVRLFTGRLAGDIEGSIAGQPFRGTASLGTGGTWSCDECEWRGTLATLQPLVNVRGLAGDVSLKMRTIDYRKGWFRRIAGTADVRNMPLALPGQAPLQGATGAFAARFDADPVGEKGVVEAEVRDLGGPLQVQGKLKLSPPGNYQFDGRMSARPGAPPELTNGLQVLGPRQADGSYSVTFAGSL
jgi:general secretion pathway protein N